MMKIHMLLLVGLLFLNCDGVVSFLSRVKRESEKQGALSIQTNHAEPIHSDVKSENTETAVTEKVAPPENAVYQPKSLRKSFLQPSKVDLARSVVRVVTLTVLLVTAAAEFYPLLRTLYNTVHAFLY